MQYFKADNLFSEGPIKPELKNIFHLWTNHVLKLSLEHKELNEIYKNSDLVKMEKILDDERYLIRDMLSF